jgi:hypothetical protein
MADIVIECGARCGAKDRVPARENPKTKALEPVAAYPWICLACWRVGWRSDNAFVYDPSGKTMRSEI